MDQLETPILFTIFNRPEETARVFAEIRKQKPLRLFIAADGPRDQAEKIKTDETRAIVSNIDWPCEVKTKFEDKNLGCKMAMSGAINWLFLNVEEGIILEDDCLPHPDFFKFCSELLEKYRDNEKIMMISGDNFQDGIKRGNGSYYFSKFDHIWGWATWRRAWKLYDINMTGLEGFLKSAPFAVRTNNKIAQSTLASKMMDVKSGKIDTWDFQWTYSLLKNDGMAILPNVNLVSNIGFGETATHTKKANSEKENLATAALGKIVHTDKIEQNKEADEYTAMKFYGKSYFQALRAKLKNIWK